eukprot:GHRR01015024.1.p1 GENE.GHRR01015024.1~~GHRR01015024.1.p1  ORF type:complete len:144 (-),score=45.66 GHRR01015024.1:589-1020(-)
MQCRMDSCSKLSLADSAACSVAQCEGSTAALQSLSQFCRAYVPSDQGCQLAAAGPLCAGRGIVEVMQLIDAYKHYSKYATQALKAANLPKMGKGSKMTDMPMNARHMQQTLQRMSGALPPQLIKQMGGIGGLQQLMKSMENMK